MAKVFLLLIILLVVVAILTRRRTLQRVLWAIVALSVLYSILKLTGAIEAIAPSRTGVF